MSLLFRNPGVQGEGGGSWEHHSLPIIFHHIWMCLFSSVTRVSKGREGGAESITHYQIHSIATESVFSLLKPGSSRGGRGSREHHSLPNTFQRTSCVFSLPEPGYPWWGKGGTRGNFSLPITYHIWTCLFSSGTQVFKGREGGAESIIHYQLYSIISVHVFSLL